VSPEADDHRRGWRTVNAAVTGIVAGVGAVVVVRAAFGPGVVVAGVLIGVVAMAAGMALSWGVLTPRRARRGPSGRRLRSRVRPLAWFAPVVGSVVAMVAWAGVAHSSGSGWVQAVGALLAAVLLTGLVAPLFAARRAAVTCLASPSDTRAGEEVELSCSARGPVRIRPRRPTGPPTRAAGPARGSRPVTVTVTPERRGVFGSVVLELASSVPFGLLWWGREVEVALPRPLHVAPRTGPPGPMDTIVDDSAGEAALRVPAGVGEPRGVRPYRPGDSRRSVHWPATSHVGDLMVRERERQTDDPVVVELVLPVDPVAAETEAERVMAALTPLVVSGRPVLLGTREPDGRVIRAVRDRVDLGRRLARAVASPVDAGPESGGPPG
jgi:uncharacterized protein (DUF58 family)